MASPMPIITLPSGGVIPALGQGTWKMGGVPGRAGIGDRGAAARLDLGMT